MTVRVHCFIQPAWGVEVSLQQLGRTNRTNQASSPIVVVIVTNLPAEIRFKMTFQERLKALGAFNHGDRNSNDNISCRLGDIFSNSTATAQECVDCVVKKFLPENKDLLKGVGLAGTNDQFRSVKLKIFFNRLLGLPVDLQDEMLSKLTRRYDSLIAEKISRGSIVPPIRGLFLSLHSSKWFL